MSSPAFAAPAALPCRHPLAPSLTCQRSHTRPLGPSPSSPRVARASLVPSHVARVARVAAGVAGVVGAALLPGARGLVRPAPAVAAETLEVPVTELGRGGLDLGRLGVRQEEFVGHKELGRLKTTQYSEAEEEIMELNEDEVENKWFYDLQIMWAGLGSVGGIFALYKGGVLWEAWIVEQEKKDMEEEIELTGQFIDPRAVRKPEDEDEDDGGGGGGKGGEGGGSDNDGGGGDSDTPPETDDLPPGGIDALEKLFGKS